MLRGDVLPQYAASLRGSDTAGLMATCLTMLSLPEDGAVQLEREQVQNEFEECGKLLGPEMKGVKALVTMPALQVSFGVVLQIGSQRTLWGVSALNGWCQHVECPRDCQAQSSLPEVPVPQGFHSLVHNLSICELTLA